MDCNAWYDASCVRHLSLTESAVVIHKEQKSYATGYVSSTVSASGQDATFIVRVDDRTKPSSKVSQFFTNSKLTWQLHDTGGVALNSSVILTGRERWNTSAVVKYGNNAYQYFAAEEISEFLCSGRGGYGGELMDWCLFAIFTFVSFFIFFSNC